MPDAIMLAGAGEHVASIAGRSDIARVNRCAGPGISVAPHKFIMKVERDPYTPAGWPS